MKRMIMCILLLFLFIASWQAATAVTQPHFPAPILDLQSPASTLVPWRCGSWFLSGVNIPWHNGAYGADFGTVEEWGNYHAYDPAATAQIFANLHAAGVNTVRWWVFTDGRGAPEFDSVSGGGVTGFDTDFLSSIDSAVTLAEQYDIYLVFNLWDFGMLDDENPDAGEHAGGHTDLIVETAKRQSFINNALIPMLNHPIANTPYTIGTHPHIIAWDIINEPEWAIIESGAVSTDISQPVTLAQMQRFVAETAAAIHQHSNQLVTVGSASLKWNSDTVLGGTANWWSDADLTPFAANGNLDFYQVHYYGWMNGDEVNWSYSPLFQSATDASLDKPTVIGEMPLNALDLGTSLADALDTIYANGYAGVWLWAYEEDGSGAFGTWPTGQPELSSFNQAHVGETAVSDQCTPATTMPDPLADRVLGQLDFDSKLSGSGSDAFNWPSGTAVAPDGGLYVVDYNNNRVQHFPSAAGFMAGTAADFSISSSSPGSDLIGPESVAVDAQGNVYVAETENHQVLIFSPGATTQANVIIGQYGIDCPAAQTTFFFPRGLALDSDGNLYVVDQFHYRVLIFSPPFTTGMLPSGVIGQPDLTSCDPDGGGAVNSSGFNGPRGAAIDTDNNLYVADSENNRVLKFDAPLTDGEAATAVLGQTTYTSNGDGTTGSQMHFPIDLALDSHNNLYVSDMFNHRVLAFAVGFSNGQAADQVYGTSRQIATNCYDTFPAAPVGQSWLYCPQGLAVDSHDNLYLADALHHRILAFDQPEKTNVYLPVIRQ